jgi:hypothetical protein
VKTRSHIRWSANGRTLYFDGKALRLEDLIKFVNDLKNIKGFCEKQDRRMKGSRKLYFIGKQIYN